jgi:hypothetical protein
MSEVTYYVALSFVLPDDGVAAADAIEYFNPNAAVMKAEALSRTYARTPDEIRHHPPPTLTLTSQRAS